MNAMEPDKESKFNHPDLAFVYITDQTSPVNLWQDYRKRIKGEHLRVSEQQSDKLFRHFAIRVLPTYIIMDRKGFCREVPHHSLESELKKELKRK